MNARKTLIELGASPFVWRPGLFKELDLDRPSVYTIRGPRRVGKTTLLKLLVRERLDSGFLPAASSTTRWTWSGIPKT